MATNGTASSPDMPITIKIIISGKDENRKFKLPLRDLGANSLPDKLRTLLNISSSQTTVFERYSDSSSSFITLDSGIPSVYKQLYRAAKAKQKLKIRVTITDKPATKPIEMPKSGSVVPDRLPTRCYVHPYISDPVKAESDLLEESRIDAYVRKNYPSAATLVPSVKSSSESQHEEAEDTNSKPSKPYYWPISENGGFSDAAKTAFQKKDVSTAAAKEKLAENDFEDKEPVPRFFSTKNEFTAVDDHSNITEALESMRQANLLDYSVPSNSFTICCNNCDKPIPGAHWHCSICERGDFDLCQDCVEKGCLCDSEDHWLIKRFVKGGKVINSTTETIAPKKATKIEEKAIPGAFTSDNKREDIHESLDLSRTCNSCVGVFDESTFVTCTVCDDYDLCIPCHVGLKHGHHPSHAFEPASKDTILDTLATKLCSPGRNMHHSAICDGCDENICGVRHKCMNCPDFDYCSTCIKKAHKTHPGHRLVPLYEPVSHKPRSYQNHVGIFCDGPLCAGKGEYIVGDRYKCAVCHDTDFCANCEALPKPTHNRTHPLIKFKTPVRNVSVTTLGEKGNGEQMRTMGDQSPQTSSKSTETTPAAPSANAATQVQTVAEVKPTESVKEEPKVAATKPIAAPELQAHFIGDTVLDGSVMPPNEQFEQTWTLRNPGPHTWPAGCTVCFIGGDGMLDVDPNHPSHVKQIHKATKSNVIDRVVEVGEEVDFTVKMRTPERQGKAISYWRLKDATGLPFGHKLWCDVDIKTPEPAVKAEETAKTEHIEDIAQHATVKGEEEAQQTESKMIFPKLDKESPVSSTHEAEAATTPAAVPSVPVSVKDLLEDVESLELDDEDSDSDEAFLTDEEYELIASDDEMETAKNGKK